MEHAPYNGMPPVFVAEHLSPLQRPSQVLASVPRAGPQQSSVSLIFFSKVLASATNLTSAGTESAGAAMLAPPEIVPDGSSLLC